MSSHEAGRQLGYAAAPLILLAIAAYAGWRMGKKRQPPKFVAWPVGVMAVLLLIAFVGLQLKKQAEVPPAVSAESR
jgi:MFS family permease